MGYYKNRKLVIATKHKKEQVIAPILENRLGVICVTPDGLDTDKLGTFTGEVERIDDILTSLRKKCEMAIEISGINVAIANEGSFGPHPSIFFAHADDEFIMLYDKENEIEIVEREVSLKTNFDGSEVKTVDELIDFAAKIGFPSHGIILKNAKDNFSEIIKLNRTVEELIENFHIIKKPDFVVYAETDMRAMNNPTRMKNIEIVSEKLAAKISSLCPNCSIPGFGVEDSVKGLPCEICNSPTNSTLKHIYRCRKCNYILEKDFPFGIQVENPEYCDYCNP